jgi:sec-independent protein translocase protein TatB
MFDFGFGEVIGLVVLALLLVGPERMPRVASDLAKMIRKVRSMTNAATAEIRENLGPGFEDLKPADLNPKTFIKRQVASVLDEEDENDRKKSAGTNPAFSPRIDPDLL